MEDASRIAVRNLLENCAGLKPGDDVIICHEDPAHGWYDAEVTEVIAAEADRIGIRVRRFEAGPPDGVQSPEVVELLASGANIVFLARIGDQGRFDGLGQGHRVMVYARSAEALASEFGCVPHPAMQALKHAVDRQIVTAERIRIICPRGTDMAGTARAQVPGDRTAAVGMMADVTTKRFPLGVPAPVPAEAFSGHVAVDVALTPTGNRSYDPAVLPLKGKVMAQIEAGRIVAFEGLQEDVSAVRAHYLQVAERFALDPFVVHSWHAGLHPGCRFFEPAGQDLDYWSNTVFSSPRVLHFHTCGTAAPGEISWNLVDATVTLDGVALWDAGRLDPWAFPGLAACVASSAELSALFPR